MCGNYKRINGKKDFDEAKEMQSAKPSFPYVLQTEWPSKMHNEIE